MEEKQLNERESLQLIEQMINMAKKEQRDDGRGWILWGWLLFLASLLTVANIRFDWFETFFFWNAFGLVTILVFLYEVVSARLLKRTNRVKTYTADFFTRLNGGFFICLFFIVMAINVGSRAVSSKYGVPDMIFVNIGFALLINLYAFWILIYGTALNFKPSVYGAYGAWAFGIVALFVQDFELVMWLQAGAVLVGYIVPGHLANREFKRLKREDKVPIGV
ncbi:MAG: hypothetical protein EOO14_14525 [Chitinophagaceae bacterium]|nr:MAG: hypothetical protein EOO14_14525 [Chitinophagaceae bacterium]